MHYVLKNVNRTEKKFFVDGFDEPTNWTWGRKKHATWYSSIEDIEKRLEKTPFEYGGMISKSSLKIVKVKE